MKISHACEVTELQRFPVLRKHLDEVMVKFFHHGVEPVERMIGNLIEMEVSLFCSYNEYQRSYSLRFSSKQSLAM
ncbi:hypothetical protein L3X38_027768 [Prunus dulcis]|uniref:Dynamin stalk domain-containing protein n=1 Tax=Prunus dulcis TaxID=3755 RepID=A0AAD4Z0K3_PRUDU|nr:hypothetical protein L3X38_027768 [Prunus dulcis]